MAGHLPPRTLWQAAPLARRLTPLHPAGKAHRMCGRYSLTASPEDVEALFALDEIDPFPPRYNIAPTQPVLTIMAAPPQPEGSNRSTNLARLARWGFIPSWVKDPKDFPLILNAGRNRCREKFVPRGAASPPRSVSGLGFL